MADTTIMIVEDEAITAEDIQQTLQSSGYTVSAVVSSGEEAIQKTSEAPPDLILMDIVLQGEMDGIETAEQIRNEFNVPVIFLTAYADETILQRAKVAEPFGYILKPFEDNDLHTNIQMALYKHQMECRLRESEKALQQAQAELEKRVLARTRELSKTNKILEETIKEYKKVEEAVQRQAERLRILHQIDQSILVAQSLEEIADGVLRYLRSLVAARRASVVLFDFDTDEFIILAANFEGSTQLEAGQRRPLSVFGGLAALQQNQPGVVDDILALPHRTINEEQLLAEGVRSYVVLPLISKGELIGAFNIGAASPGAFSPEDIEISSEVANQLAVAIQNTRLYEEIYQQAEELAALNTVSQAITASLDLQEILDLITDHTTRLSEAAAASVVLYDETSNDLWFATATGRGAEFIQDQRLPWGQGVVGWVIQHGQPLLISDVQQDSRHFDGFDREGGFATRSILCVPLVVKEQVIGAIEVINKQGASFTQKDLKLLHSLATPAAIAIEHARLFEAEQNQRRHTEALQAAGAIVGSSLDLAEVLDLLLIALGKVVAYNSTSVFLKEGDHVHLAAGRGLPDTSVIGQRFPYNELAEVIEQTRQPLILNDVQADRRFQPWGDNDYMSSWMGVPLLVQQRLVGYFTLDHQEPEAYTETDANLVMSFANQAAIAVENAQLYMHAQEEIVERQRVEDALRWAYDEVEMRVLTRTMELAGVNDNLKQEISERKRAEAALQRSEARYRAIIEDQMELICRFKPNGMLTFVNDAYCRYFERAAEELIGHTFELPIPEEDLEVVQQLTSTLSPENPVVTHEHRVITPGGEIGWLQWTDRMIFDSEGQLIEIQSVGRDITERKVATQQLEHTAWHDALTDLPNRALFINRLRQAINQAKQREEYLFAVLFIDLDRFKNINDSLGHFVGDQLLVAIARRLEGCVRPGDMVARLGGDEFTILLDNIRNINEVTKVAGRIQNELVSPVNLGEHQIFTTASIGITAGSKQYERAEDLLRDADTAMYQAKARGRARYEIFDIDHHTLVRERWQLETDLWQAVEHEELVLYYQPIVSLASGQITGVEALLRWQHPQRGLLAPDEFLLLAEETGLIVPIGEWVLRAACIQAQAWHAAGYASLDLAVNVSARQFQDQNLPGLIETVLTETGLPAQALDLEINESMAMKNREAHIKELHTLRAMGLRISIDDFGLGSSLDCLKRLPLDALKINQVFVKEMTDDGDDAAIITAIIALAHGLNLKVIAEGVELEKHLAFLRAQQCDEVQGHLFSEPVPAETLTTLLQEWDKHRFMPGENEERKYNYVSE